MRLVFITTLTALSAVVGAAGCSAIVDSDEFTSNPQQRLVDLQTERVAEWCDCFAAGTWGPLFDDSADTCKSMLSPSDDYAQCLVDAVAEDLEEYGDAVQCFLDAKEAGVECEQGAACTLPGHQQCQMQLATSELLCKNDAPDAYLAAVDKCATDHMVGPPRDTCPEDPFEVPVIVGANAGLGNDFDFPDSEDEAGDACFWVIGGADDVIQWAASTEGGATSGDVLIDTIGSTYDTALYLIDDCNDANVITCNDDIKIADGLVQSRIRHSTTPGDPLTVVVDALSPSALGAYRLNFTTLWCVDDGDGPPVESGTGQAVFEGFHVATDGDDMTPLGDDGDGACTTPVAGVDRVVTWQAPAAGTYTFDTAGSDFDTILYARRSCDADGAELCSDDATGTTSEVQMSLMQGETIILVVDSKDPMPVGTETWQLNITPG